MKLNLCKCSAVLLNLFEGAVAVIALAMIYAFMFEANNSNHSIGMGLLVLLVWLAVLCIPNLLFRRILPERWRTISACSFSCRCNPVYPFSDRYFMITHPPKTAFGGFLFVRKISKNTGQTISDMV